MSVIRLPSLIGAVTGILLLFSAAAHAQTTTVTPAKPKSKSATVRHAAPAPRSVNADYWSLNYTTPTRYDTRTTLTRDVTTTELTGELGRVPLQAGQGTIGFDSHSRLNPNVPGGVNPNTRQEDSFVGMSVNVPSLSKNLPLPVLPSPPGPL